MEYAESNGAAGGGRADDVNRRTNEPAGSQPWPHTAIERQLAAASAHGQDPRAQGAAAHPYGATSHPRNRRRKTDRRKTRRFGLGGFLVLLWLVAVGLIAMFTDFGRMLERKVVDATTSEGATVNNLPSTVQSASTNQSALARQSAPSQSIPATQAPTDSAQVSSNSSQSSAPPTQTATPTENAVNAVQPNAAEPSEALSVPIADASLRTRPELVEQLVQVYRSQLAANPQDKITQTALERLQERSLADTQAILASGDAETANKALQLVSRLFPELKDNVRYKYLVARTDYMRRQTNDVSASKPEKTTAAAVTPVASAVAAASSTTSVAAPVTAKKSSESVSSSKPEIRDVSIMPGTMVDDSFVPSDGGNIFMVEISYRNFDRAFIENPAATLVTLLGTPDDNMVLAEVPVIITADRGTKSFVMETNSVQGYSGGKFQLNFMLNDEFLTSRTLRLSRPR